MDFSNGTLSRSYEGKTKISGDFKFSHSPSEWINAGTLFFQVDLKVMDLGSGIQRDDSLVGNGPRRLSAWSG